MNKEEFVIVGDVIMKVYNKTGIKCYICNEELKLVEDIYLTEFSDGEILKDVDYYFECPNGCDGEYEDMNDYDKKIDEIIEKHIKDEMNYEDAMQSYSDSQIKYR